MRTDGLSLDQAPPLVIPTSFFLLAPLSLIAAGLLLMLDGGALVGTRFHPAAMALTHLLTLGVLGAVMFGALYQMIPVVAGSPVPAARIAHLVHLDLVVGLAALVWGYLSAQPAPFLVALGAFTHLLILFLVPVGIALVRAPIRSDTVRGMRLAVTGLAGVAIFGLVLAFGRMGGRLAAGPSGWLAVHVSLGLVAWVGGLISSVSWQVIPMFYLTPEAPRWARRTVQVGVGLALVAPPTAFALGLSTSWVWASLAPGAATVWLLHPAITAWTLQKRRRRRKDVSQRFWWAGLTVAPLVLVAGVLAALLSDPRWPVLFAWLALFGWAGLIVHGMLTRILPFLVWFHRFSALVGLVKVPAMKQMLPDRRARIGFWAHLATLGLGAAAILTFSPLLARAAGLSLALTGLALGSALLRVLAHRPSAEQNAPLLP